MKRARRASLLVASVAAVLLAGCGEVGYELAQDAWHLPVGMDTSMFLLADDDVAPDEMVEFFDHGDEGLKPLEEPSFHDPLPPRRKRTTARPSPRPFVTVGEPSRFGVRAGYLSISSAQYEWPGGVLGGLFYNVPAGKVAFEIGAEYLTMEADTGDSATTLTFIRGDVLLGLGATLQLIVGGRAIVETPEVEAAEDTVIGGAAGAGLGVRFGKMDIRAMYNQIFSEGANTESYLDMSAGVAF